MSQILAYWSDNAVYVLSSLPFGTRVSSSGLSCIWRIVSGDPGNDFGVCDMRRIVFRVQCLV